MGQTQACGSCCAETAHPEVQAIIAQSSGQAPGLPEPEIVGHDLPDTEDTRPHRVSVDFTRGGPDPLPLLRGVPLRRTLQQRGKLWRYRPSDLNMEERSQLFESSVPVAQLDVFVSHAWQTPGRWKYLSLLVQYGWRTMLTAWAAGTSLTFILCLLNVLPAFLDLNATVAGVEIESQYGCWIMLAGLVSALVGLLVSPHLPFSKSPHGFLDFVCIHQTDAGLMQEGINNISSFLAASKELRILWSPPYLSRLWCVFELASYRKLNPSGQIRVQPIMVEATMVQIYFWVHAFGITSWLNGVPPSQGSGAGEIFAVMGLGCFLLPLVHALRKNFLYKQTLLSDLSTFDVQKVSCHNESDKECIHAAIVQWYGSLDAFSQYVRGPLRDEMQEMLHASGQIQFPFGYACVLSTPVINKVLELWVAYWNGDAPPEGLLGYTLSMLVGMNFFWFPAMWALLMMCCETGVGCGSCRRSSCLQTLTLSIVLWSLFLLGRLCAVRAYNASLRLAVAWLAVTVVFFLVVFRCRFKQRSACAWRKPSA